MARANNGRVFRKDGVTVVEIKGKEHLLDIPGVICTNPSDAVAQRIYQKSFVHKPIYLPNQYKKAYYEILNGTDVIVIGMNGYTDISEEKCRIWGVKPGGYEAACRAILHTTAEKLMSNLPGIDVRFAHGASYMGVDGAIIQVAKNLNRPQLGHSCPEYMFYVEDDDIPVYVARNKDQYSHSFITSLHILIGANGRVTAFEMDIDAVFKKKRDFIQFNVLKTISTNGGPPAFGPDGEIEDAIAAYQKLVHNAHGRFSQELVHWDDILDNIHSEMTGICRGRLDPSRAYGGH